MPEALIIVYASENGRDGWAPVMPADIPEFVKDPDCMGKLLAGYQVMDPSMGETGSRWYRAAKYEAPTIQ